ncbi:hypothetical protein GNI_177850 [Gregarina niphandrodes]|uniref:Uncharacterized protein n=1 Tax=Gregarina niphandrodes TaxID=110365 RepID=A0A023AXE1_GRENI|nr:hypothetical protein GNI_177850 [Gregarina niphandrodes]EZG43287.1 hypothetical protein GNI_177850 [Gregarina niphandrodes]|eukprot:XP_011133453.1 hypothetical protein GNI_177850 [Gregarina niphandrodes]
MRTFTAVQPVGGAELLAALVTSDGLQPELDDQTSARFLTFDVKGEGQVHAVALGSEVELQELDAKLEASELNQCKLVFESISRLKVFNVPEQTTPHSVVRSSLKKFLDEKTGETETRRQIWVDAFGKCQFETEHTGDDRHTGVAEDTGAHELQVFTRKLNRKELPRLLPKVQQDWREGMKRSAVSSWTDCLGLEVARDAFNRYPLQTKLAVAGGALLAAAGCYFNFFPPGASGAPSGNDSTDLENYAKILPCANETQLERTLCVEGIPYCMTARLKPERGCLPLPSEIGFGKLSEIARTATFDVCRASGRCEVADILPTRISGASPSSTSRVLEKFSPCVNEADLERAVCVNGVPLCVSHRQRPELGCLPMHFVSEIGIDKLGELASSTMMKVCRLSGECGHQVRGDTKSVAGKNILPCVNETRLDQVLCVERVPICLTSNEDSEKTCSPFQFDPPLRLLDLGRLESRGLTACRAKTGCGVLDVINQPGAVLPCFEETHLDRSVCVGGVPFCVTLVNDPEKSCWPFRSSSDLQAMDALPFYSLNVCQGYGRCEEPDIKTRRTNPTPSETTEPKIFPKVDSALLGIVPRKTRWSKVSTCVDRTHLERAVCVEGLPFCVSEKGDDECWTVNSNYRLKLGDLGWFQMPGSKWELCRGEGGCHYLDN